MEIPAPDGNEWSHVANGMRGMDQYVHLCFRATHAMEYVARQEGRIGDTIFLQIHPEVLQWEGVKFTPDVANKAGVQVYSMEEAREEPHLRPPLPFDGDKAERWLVEKPKIETRKSRLETRNWKIANHKSLIGNRESSIDNLPPRVPYSESLTPNP